MTDLSRGARPGAAAAGRVGCCLTVLLVLAIGASSALVFTNRVELLKLAVILALWAAVVAAFVSVIYRRQSDVDQAKARDLKLVYDLQLDREISARREYELTVESQLRRELAIGAARPGRRRGRRPAGRTGRAAGQPGDSVRRRPGAPARARDRSRRRAYSDWPRDTRNHGPGHRQPDRHRRPRGHRRRTPRKARSSTCLTNPIRPRTNGCRRRARRCAPQAVGGRAGGAAASRRGAAARVVTTATAAAACNRRSRSRAATWQPPQQERPPPPPPEPPLAAPPPTPRARTGARSRRRRRGLAARAGEGEWIPAGAPGSNWVSPRRPSSAEPTARTAPPAASDVGSRRAARQPAATHRLSRRCRGTGSAGDAVPAADRAAAAIRRHPDAVDPGARLRRRHWPPSRAARTPSRRPSPTPAPEPPPRSRRRGGTAAPRSTGGQSVADLLARLQAAPTGGGRRRRREE